MICPWLGNTNYYLNGDGQWPRFFVFYIQNIYNAFFGRKNTWVEGLGWGEYNGKRTDVGEGLAAGRRAPDPGSWTAGSPAHP